MRGFQQAGSTGVLETSAAGCESHYCLCHIEVISSFFSFILDALRQSVGKTEGHQEGGELIKL